MSYTRKTISERVAAERNARPRTFVFLHPPNPKTQLLRPEGEETVRQLRTEFYLLICALRQPNMTGTLYRVQRAQRIQ